MSDYQYPLSTGRSNILGTEAFRNLLAKSLSKAEKEVTILSAYVKVIGVEWLKDNLTNQNIKCTIIARWDKGDIAQGSSDLDCYKICKDNNWQFRILKDLHAKIMLVDNKDLFIGSPNLTGHGMSLIPVSNKEMGVKLDATSSDINIINNLIEESVVIDDDIFEELKIWKDKLPEIKKQSFPSFPKIVDDKIKDNFDKVWVHNFPWSDIKELLNDPGKNSQDIIHDLELFGVTSKDKGEIEKARSVVARRVSRGHHHEHHRVLLDIPTIWDYSRDFRHVWYVVTIIFRRHQMGGLLERKRRVGYARLVRRVNRHVRAIERTRVY